MPGPRDYSQSTRAALAVLSRGNCYFPGCPERLLRFVDGEPYINYQIAHIRDARPGSRYDASMSDDERRAFKNLILLCKPHHELVDKRHPERFSTDDLARWKAEKEGTSAQALSELGAVDADDLEQALREGAQVQITDSTFHLGGQGGSAPGSGGGGGGAVGGGIAGSGGRGGDIVNLNGLPATAPGAGGGGGGAIGPEGVAGEGGGGGEAVTKTLRVEENDRFEIEISNGGGPGEPGLPTILYRVLSDGTREVVARAEGGRAGRSGIALLDEQLGPAVAISAAMFADVVHVRNGLLYVLGGGWNYFAPDALPGRLTAAFVVLAEAHVSKTRITELLFEVKDAQGVVRQEQRESIPLEDVPDPRRIPIAFGINVDVVAPGIWQVVVSSGGVELASVPIRIVEPGEAASHLDE
jgi:hypothetical protein